MRVVVRESEVFAAEVEEIFLLCIERHGREWSRFVREHRFDSWDLVDEDVSIGNAVDEFIRFSTRDVSEHHRESCVLDQVGRHADRRIARALEHVESKLVFNNTDVHPAMARGYNHLLLLALATALFVVPASDEVKEDAPDEDDEGEGEDNRYGDVRD